MNEKGKVCVLVSGGLDSYVAYRYAFHLGYEVYPLFVNLGQPYLRKELAALHKLVPDAMAVDCEFASPRLNNCPTVDKQEIHGRNLMLILYGALLAPRVWISSLETENTPATGVTDRQPEVFEDMARVMSKCMHPHGQEAFIVESPFQEMSKTEVVLLGKNIGIPDTDLAETISCYDGEGNIGCGNCSSCYKKWIALKNNGIGGKFLMDPAISIYGKSLVEDMLLECRQGFTGRFTVKRYREMIMAGQLPPETILSVLPGSRVR